MTGPNRSPVRGSVRGRDHQLPDHHTERAPPYDEFDDADDPDDPWSSEDDHSPPLGERLDILRRKYMPLPDEVVYEFLGEDEYVVHSDHPSFRAFLTQNIAFVVLIPVAGPLFVFFLLGGITRETILVFLFLDLLVAVLALRRLGDRYTSYVITNLRLIKVTGILRRKLASIPWTGMTGLGFRQTALGRVLGYATIKVESANEESGLREFSDVNDPALFHQRLLDMASARSRSAAARHHRQPTTGEKRGLFQKQKRKGRPEVAPQQGEVAGQRHRPTGTAGTSSVRDTASSGPLKGGGGTQIEDAETPWPDEEDAEAPWPDEEDEVEDTPTSRTVDPDRHWLEDEPSPSPSPSTPPPSTQPAAAATPPPEPPPPSPSAPASEPAPRPADDPAPADRPAPTGRARRGRWLRWPGSTPEPELAGTAADTPNAPEEPRPPRQRPSQRAPRQPETIVVPTQAPQAASSSRRRQQQQNPRWPGRRREIP